MQRVGGQSQLPAELSRPPLLRGFGDPAGRCWQRWSRCPLTVTRCCRSSLRPQRLSQPCLSLAVVLSPVLGALGFSGLAGRSAGSGVPAGSGSISSAAHMENTRSNHKEWRWRLTERHRKRSSVGAYGMGTLKLPHLISAGVVLRNSFPCAPGLCLRSRAVQMSHPVDVVGPVDAPSRRENAAKTPGWQPQL